MRTTAEISREAVHRAFCVILERRNRGEGAGMFDIQEKCDSRDWAMLAATYACELAQADAAALLAPVRMRASDGGTRR